MIPGSAVYHAVEAMVPLYTAAVLGYASVRWLKAFSDEQCAGINHFVALYAVPVLIFHMVSTNDPYRMNARLVAADTLQKAAVLLALTAWAFSSRFRTHKPAKGAASPSPLKWVVTNFSVASLPNTVIIGVPLLDGMYGSVSGGLMKQIVVMQFCIWYTVVIFLYEFMEARADGSAKISPVSENGADHQAVVNIEVTEMAAVAAASPADDDAHSAPEQERAAAEASDGPPMMYFVWKVMKKLLIIPNTYASFLGLIWSLIAFKIGFSMPKIVDGSLSIIHTTAVGLSMFSSGLSLTIYKFGNDLTTTLTRAQSCAMSPSPARHR